MRCAWLTKLSSGRSNHRTLMMLVNRNDLDGDLIDLVAQLAVQQADALMAELGLSLDKED